MACITQAEKKVLAPSIKAVLKKYGVKGSIGVKHHMTLVVNIKAGALDFIGDANKSRIERAEKQGTQAYEITNGHYQLCNHYVGDNKGAIGKFFDELIKAMKGTDWFDESDSQTDYFHIAYYLNVNVGKWNKPYILKQV